jgi:hypothetical protein
LIFFNKNPKNISKTDINYGTLQVSLFFPGEIYAIFFLGHTGFIDQLAQQSHTEIPSGMNRDWEVNMTSLFYQDMVAPLNVVLHPSCPLECCDVLFF